MIRAEGLRTQYISNLEFNVKPGQTIKLVFASRAEKDSLMDVLSGASKPLGGEVFLFDRALGGLSNRARLEIYSRMGFVRGGGGLISNLKVWENIMLPLQYHHGTTADQVEPLVIEILSALGVPEDRVENILTSLPGVLPYHRRTQAGFVRAALMEPDLMIYDSIFEDLDNASAERLARTALVFHQSSKSCASIFVTADRDSLDIVQTDQTIEINQEDAC